MKVVLTVAIVIIVLILVIIVLAARLNRKSNCFNVDSKLWKDRKHTFLGLPISFTVYSMTNERMFINKGLFTSVEDEVRLYRVLDIKLRQTLCQKIFGLGDIILKTSDKSMQNFTIKNICHSKQVKELLSENVEEQRKKNRVSSRELMIDNDEDMDNDDTELV